MRVGIPRALLYHRYFPAWERFFTELGAEVVVSSETNKQIMNLGLQEAESEICLPVKVYYGHAMSLRGRCDYLFVPRIVAVEKSAYTCPKFLGLPDMMAIVEGLPEIIAPTINLKKGKKVFKETIFQVGERFTSDRGKIWKAYKAAMKALRRHNRELVRKGKKLQRRRALSNGAVGNGTTAVAATSDTQDAKLRIGVAGHAYNILDPYVSLHLLERLEERGVELVIPENVSERKIRRAAKDAPKDLFWTYEREVLGATYHWIKNRVVDGIIYVMAFPCGPDSTIQVMMEGAAKRSGDIPLMSLVLDEHSAEAGLVTRLEAFVDLLTERKLAAQAAV